MDSRSNFSTLLVLALAVFVASCASTQQYLLRDWTSADYFSNVSAVLLFVVAWWLGRRQGQIIEEVHKLALRDGEVLNGQAELIKLTKDLTEKVHGLQTAVVALQIREKVGVMKQRAVQVDGDPAAAITLLTDSCSVLDVYPYAPDVLRKDYIKALDTAFSSLCKACVTEGKQMRAELASAIVRQAKSLFDTGERDLSFPLIKPVAKCAISLHTVEAVATVGDSCAGDFCSLTDQPTPEMLERLLSMSETTLMRKLDEEFPSN